jgi:DNA-binding ferritin-like protein
MDKAKVAAALYNAADIAAAAAGDLHTLHLNVRGSDFDSLHKAFRKYYEEADSDYDDLAEWGRCCAEPAPNKNESAKRAEWDSLKGSEVTRSKAVKEAGEVLDALSAAYHKLLKAADKIDDPLASGLSNWLQGRLEYWTKEKAFFNESRRDD